LLCLLLSKEVVVAVVPSLGLAIKELEIESGIS
jgi:hypothetical protein